MCHNLSCQGLGNGTEGDIFKINSSVSSVFVRFVPSLKICTCYLQHSIVVEVIHTHCWFRFEVVFVVFVFDSMSGESASARRPLGDRVVEELECSVESLNS